RCGLQEVAGNLEPDLSEDANFEFDMAAVRGHQLFALTCSNRAEDKGSYSALKHKLFEALLRARQIGGDEARVALVCCREEVQGLKPEAPAEIGREVRPRVCGGKDLADLSHPRAGGFRQQSGRDDKWKW